MDRATLPYAKSQIAHCTPSKITSSNAASNIKSTLLHRLLVISTYMQPKLHLVELVFTYYASKFATYTQEIEPLELEP